MPDDKPEIRPESVSEISFSQAVLAPIDAILKAQVHAARSFLNLILQLGYGHISPKGPGGNVDKDALAKEQRMYTQDFAFESLDAEGNKQTTRISIPTLALIPVSALGVDNAEVEFDFQIREHRRANQLRESVRNDANLKLAEAEPEKRPWFLVDPVDFVGGVSNPAMEESASNLSQSSSIHIKVSIGKQPMSSGLEKLLSTLNQSAHVHTVNDADEPVNP